MAQAGGVRSVAEQAAATGSPRQARVWARARRGGHVRTAGADHVEALDLMRRSRTCAAGARAESARTWGVRGEGHGGTVAGVAATSGRWRLRRRRRRRGGARAAGGRRHRGRWSPMSLWLRGVSVGHKPPQAVSGAS
ncbi:hypothetical protein VPH35_054848 [Triticum aestivum]